MLALQRKAPYGFPSGLRFDICYIKENILFLFFSKCVWEREKRATFLFDTRHKTLKRGGFCRPKSLRPSPGRRCPHAADYDSSCQSHTSLGFSSCTRSCTAISRPEVKLQPWFEADERRFFFFFLSCSKVDVSFMAALPAHIQIFHTFFSHAH